MAVTKDAAEIARLFQSIPAQVKRDIEPAIDQGATEIMMRARYLAPSDDGDLRDSIRKEAGERELSVRVFTDSDHALYQEYGTVKMARNSFWWVAVNTTKKRVKRRIDRAISKAIDKAWGKK
ncbi:HK97 gp10 family phage protein [Rhizobium grahamii]|uniref:HK97 gp10 family phage protein n=1 Tax=Rhizobium grahamii TaxID=1120045 RepID=A0A5Q0C3A1_9HYPH|nr:MULTISPECIES: HK97-gp10 family putative phage morphogenesis protein [Rhizobium]QFY60366.1 HK97 gp10 family phage protein [Rhizobium grahamii]QRM50508.1 HK97 gp10 family phage protein [Rhizobium sp. BG6]